MLDEASLTNLILDRNRAERFKALVIGAGSLLLWLVSLVMINGFAVLICVVVFRFFPNVLHLSGITVVVAALLCFEAWRYRRELFDWSDYWNSASSVGANWVGVSGVGLTRGTPMQAAYGISQLMLCAPRSTVSAWRHFRKRIDPDPKIVPEAVSCFERMSPKYDWLPASTFGRNVAGLRYLDHAGLLWTREADGKVQVKLDATARADWLGA